MRHDAPARDAAPGRPTPSFPATDRSEDASMTSTRHRAFRAPLGTSLALLGALGLAACGTVSSAVNSVVGGSGGPAAGQPGFVSGFLGGVAADEPRAALVGRDVLSAGGTAVDAAVAAGFALSATLPSRAGIGGGGACLVYDPVRNSTEAVVFPAGNPGGGGDRPAAIPMMARGLFALHTRKPRRPFEELVSPAEQLARFGTPASRALATDLAAVAGPLLADAGARAVFAPAGQPLREGEVLSQPDLGATLAALRVSGVGDLYQGAQARRLEELSPRAGGPLTVAALRPAVAQVMPPLQVTLVNDTLSFLPPPADGGLAAAVAAQALAAGQAPAAAEARGLAVAGAWRAGGAEPAALLANPPAGGGAMGTLPASTTLVVLDREGGAVSCAFSMNNLFGTGRLVPGMGMFLAAAPGVGRVEPPLLSAVLVHNRNLKAFRFAGAGSGQAAAPLAAALPAIRQLVSRTPLPQALAEVPEPGRTNAISCDRYLPGDPRQCVAGTDARGAGLAIGGQ